MRRAPSAGSIFDADVNAEGGYNGNALQAASANGHEKIVELLKQKRTT